MNVFLTIDRNNMTIYIYIIALGKREMRRTRCVVIRLKGQHTVNLLSQSKEEKKRRKEGQAFNLTSDYFDATREKETRQIFCFVHY
jgi:hypothetical protein